MLDCPLVWGENASHMPQYVGQRSADVQMQTLKGSERYFERFESSY